MNQYDKKYLAKHVMGTDPELDWYDTYAADYDDEDDQSIPFDDEDELEIDDDFSYDDPLFED